METILQAIKEHQVQFVDLRFTDTRGQEHHLTVPASRVDGNFLRNGKMFDGSSISGWKNIAQSDMILMPDSDNPTIIDPFCEKPTLLLRCDVIEPSTMRGYERDPRSLAKRAEAYLKSTGIGDTCYFGPEPEFFIFDNVRWKNDMHSAFYAVDSQEGIWNSETQYPQGNLGHRAGVKNGYFPVPPVDSSQDIRSTMCTILEGMGIPVEVHHHEVGHANQNEIGYRFNSLLKKSDETQLFKYVVHNVAHNFGKTATFMPKPLVGENGSGMHCHQSLAKGDQNLFAGEEYAGLSELGIYYIGGIIKHACALSAFTNPSTNSYKRLIPGFEAPVMLAYSARNRSAAIRIPFVSTPKETRIEVRFPDCLANPYLAFSAMMMAGLDGILNKIHPGEPMDKDLYALSPQEAKNIPFLSHSLDHALAALKEDNAFLLKGNVFSQDMLEGYISIKEHEIGRLRRAAHPVEFEMYYSL